MFLITDKFINKITSLKNNSLFISWGVDIFVKAQWHETSISSEGEDDFDFWQGATFI